MTGIEITPEFERVLRSNGLETFDQFLALPATNIVRAVPGRSTLRIKLPGFVGYLKRYEADYLTPPKKILRSLRWPGADDEAAREWRNIHLLRHHDFLTATPVALGRRGDVSFLLQQEIVGGLPADEYLQQLKGPRRWQLLKQIGRLARRLRDEGFIHKDLYLKHIFVVERNLGWDLFLIDLQRVLGPRRHRERWYLKDAAALAYSVRARAGGSRADLLRIYQGYAPGKIDKVFLQRIWNRVLRLLTRTPRYKRVWNA